MAEMLSEFLDIPFPRNQLPYLSRNIIHGHFMSCVDRHQKIHVIRDGRDVMISFYYHCLFVNDLFNETLVNRMQPRYKFQDKEDVVNNLPIFMEDLFSNKVPFGFNWPEFVLNWHEIGIPTIKYESLLTDCFSAMQALIVETHDSQFDQTQSEKLREIINKHDFTKQKQLISRDNDTEVSFLRAGKAAQWKTIFNNESKTVFKHFAGDALIKLGYEASHDW